MKAHINGVTIEGTPQEIAEYQRLQAQQAHEKWQKQIGTGYDPTWFMPKIMSGGTTAIIDEDGFFKLSKW